MSKLPFVGRTFWKTLAVVGVLVVVVWIVALRLLYKEGQGMTPADWVGTVISTILFAYLIHLWLLPVKDHHPKDDSPPDHEEAE